MATSVDLPSDIPILWRESTGTEAEYEKARCRVFNLKVPDRFPRAIIRAKTVEHIQAGVKLAEKLQCQVAIRSGGHSWACWSLRDQTVLIDLVDFEHMAYDPVTDTLEASPSTMGLQAGKFLRDHGRFVPLGHCGEVGFGGFLLQGGMGMNCRGYGWACEYVKAIDVVTADGEIKHCDHNQNSDLFWVARGCGPGFPAVVTRFYLHTRPYLPAYKKVLYFWPISEYDTTMRWVVEMSPTLHDDVEPLAVSAFHPQFQQRVFMFQATSFGLNEADALEKLRVLKETRPPNALQCFEGVDTSIEDEYAYAELMNPPNHRWIADNVYIPSTGCDVVDVCRRSWTDLPADGIAFYEPLRSRTGRVLPDMSLSLETDHYIAIYSASQNAGDDVVNVAWVAERMRELERSAAGSYLGDADFQARSTKFWSDEAGRNLTAVRKKWDPQRRFCGYLTEEDKEQDLDNILHVKRKTDKPNL